jgi:hypothetical protein
MADTGDDGSAPGQKNFEFHRFVDGEANGGSAMRSMQAFLISHQIFLNPRFTATFGINPMAVRGGAKSEGPSATHGVLRSLRSKSREGLSRSIAHVSALAISSETRVRRAQF